MRTPRTKKVRLVLAALLCLSPAVAALSPGVAHAVGTGSALYSPNLGANPNEDASYPRVIRLAHSGASNGTLLATFSHSGNGSAKASFPIYRSTDGGQTWTGSPI